MDEGELEKLAEGIGTLSLEQAEELCGYIAGQVDRLKAEGS